MTTEQPGSERPLQGWKEIAAYLERDVRTAMRWEKTAGLPVRRYSQTKGSSVYAYAGDLDAWRTGNRPAAEEHGRGRRWAPWVLAATVAVGAWVVIRGPFLNPRSPVAEAAEGSMRAEQVWTDQTAGTYTRLAPGGRWAVYADEEVRLRPINGGPDRTITSLRPSGFPETSAISPDGKRLAVGLYNDDEWHYELRVIEIGDDGPVDRGKTVYHPIPPERGYVEAIGWLSNTRVLLTHAMVEISRLVIVDLEENSIRVLKTIDWQYPVEAVVSPDGKWVAYGTSPRAGESQHDIRVLATDGSLETVIAAHPADDLPVGWTPDGSHFLFRSARTAGQSLWAVRFADGKAAGKPRLVSGDFSASRIVGLSPEGDLYYVKRTGFRSVYQAEVDFETGRLLAEPAPIETSFVGDNYGPAYSPDGKRMAYVSNRSLQDFAHSDEVVILIRDLATGAEHEIALHTIGVGSLSWSNDSSSLLFKGRNKGKRWAAFRVPVDGGEAELLVEPDIFASSEGQKKNFSNLGWAGEAAIHYREGYTGGGAHWIHDLASGEKRQLLPPGQNHWLTVAPDGSRFALRSLRNQGTDHVEHAALLTLDLASGQLHELIAWPRQEGDHYSIPTPAAWTPDGRRLVFWKTLLSDLPPMPADLWVLDLDAGTERRTELSIPDLATPLVALSVHPDGRRVAFSAGERKYEIWKLSNFLDRLAATD